MSIGSDTFSGTGPLGVTEVGAIAWEILAGTWARGNGYAVTSTARTSNPLAVLGTGSGDVDLSLSVSPSGGDALYFRVQDINNWYRLIVQSSSSSYWVASYTYWDGTYNDDAQYLWDGTYSYAGWVGVSSACGTGYNSVTYDTSNPALYTRITFGTQACTNSSGSQGHTYTYATNTGTKNYYWTARTQHMVTIAGYWQSSTTYTVALEKSITGTVTRLFAYNPGYITTLRIVAQGSTITPYLDTVAQGSTTQTELATAVKHGIGRGDPTGNDGSAIYSFSITQANTPPNAPALTSPLNNIILNRHLSQAFSWVPSDPDFADTQTKFDLEYQLIGGAFTTVTVSTSAQVWNSTVDLFPLGDYAWHIRTYDSQGAVGPYSVLRTFTAADSLVVSSSFIGWGVPL